MRCKNYKLFDHLSLCSTTLLFFNLIFFISAGEISAGQATLSWIAPAINEDGTPLTDLAGYSVYYGISSQNYNESLDVEHVTTYTVGSLTEGQTYYFAVTAYDNAFNNTTAIQFMPRNSSVMDMKPVPPWPK